MTSTFPAFTILPGTTRVSEAVRQAHAAGAGLYLTHAGKVIIAPIGRPGWLRLPICSPETLPCAA